MSADRYRIEFSMAMNDVHVYRNEDDITETLKGVELVLDAARVPLLTLHLGPVLKKLPPTSPGPKHSA